MTDALGIAAEIKLVDPRGLSRLLAPYGPTDRRDRFGKPGSAFAPPWPDIAIACGRLTTPYIRALRRRSGVRTYTVILLDPKTGPNTADLFWVPNHDRRRGANVITSLTSPHRFSPHRLAELRDGLPPELANLPHPAVAVLIGGPNGDFTYHLDDMARLRALLEGLAREPLSLMITCSRRTPPALADMADETTRSMPHRVFFRGGPDNPYPHFLARADSFVVTADSVNMVGEACATGRPVHVFYPSGGSPKFARFHESLQRYGATRPLTEADATRQTWSYEPLFSATDIAAEIRTRYLRRCAALGKAM